MTDAANQPGWAKRELDRIGSVGVCGQHGLFVGSSCPKCVTQVKRWDDGRHPHGWRGRA